MSATAQGFCDPRFAGVRDAFDDSLARGKELGASVSVVLDGVTVVNLWGGFADRGQKRPWSEDTLVNVFSTTKGVTSVLAHRLVDEGKLDVDAPAARLWPELDTAGKGAITTRMLLSHRAGLPALREPLPPEALFDWERMTSALAAEEPWWEPGSRHGYHPFTFGWLVGEVIRRASGKTVNAYLLETLAGPLGLDLRLGAPVADDARCAELRASGRADGDPPTLFERIMAEPTSMTAKAFTNPFSMVAPGSAVSRAWRDAELPAVNAHATALAIARLYGALARGGELDGVRVLSRERIDDAREERSRGLDAVLGVDTRFGSGFMLTQPGEAFGPNASAFGHTGAGGSLGFADPEARIGFSYVMNRMGTAILVDARARTLIDALYAAL
jgi:CubicO group peptidase (beta-lactamase class C family)